MKDYRELIMDAINEGTLDAKTVVQDALYWMSTDEAEEFAERNGYAEIWEEDPLEGVWDDDEDNED